MRMSHIARGSSNERRHRPRARPFTMGGEVDQWEVDACPFPEECSANAWKKAYVKSQTSEEHARKILWYHLTVSSLHNKQSREDIHSVCTLWPVTCCKMPKWPNQDQRFEGCSLEIPDPEDEEAHTAMLQELCNAKRKLGDDSGPLTTAWDELLAISGHIGIRPRALAPKPRARGARGPVPGDSRGSVPPQEAPPLGDRSRQR